MAENYAREVALEILARDGVFDPSVHRVVEGVASTAKRNKNGNIIEPFGAEFTLPIPMLLAHDWLRPIGRVTVAKATLDGLTFTGLIATDKLPWVKESWEAIKTGTLRAVSISANPIKTCPDRIFVRWQWDELSACTSGANPDALIVRVKEVYRPDVIWFDGKKHETVYRDVRPKTSQRPGVVYY